ncbi:MAG: hypothetical protein ACKVOE_02810 [Rickettsiales bacterium]
MKHVSQPSEAPNTRPEDSFIDHPAMRWAVGIGGVLWTALTGMANISKACYQSLKYQEPLSTARALRDKAEAGLFKKYANIVPKPATDTAPDTLTKFAERMEQNAARVLNPKLNEELETVSKTYSGVVKNFYRSIGIPIEKGVLSSFKTAAAEFAHLKRHERSTVIFSTITSVMIPFMGLALLSVGARAKKNAQWQQDVNEHQERNLIALRKQIDAQERSADRGI